MVDQHKWLVIVNPNAGYHCSDLWYKRLVCQIRQKLDSLIIFTSYPGHATEIVRQNWEFENIGVYGGDGTIAEVINGMDFDRQRMLVFPGGTGNGLAHDLGIHSLENAFSAIQTGQPRVIDLIDVNFHTRNGSFSRLMVSTSGIGYVTAVARLASRIRPSLRSNCYKAAAVCLAISIRLPEFTALVKSDGCNPDYARFCSLIINNTRHIGNVPVFKSANMHDGRFEVSLAQPVLGLYYLKRLTQIGQRPPVTWSNDYQSRYLSIFLKEPHYLMIDGELLKGVIQAEYKIWKKHLLCIA